jgi:hypothetical protein
MSWRRSGVFALLSCGAPFSTHSRPCRAATRFTFTPPIRDPAPGTLHWEKRGTGYVETLPSMRAADTINNELGG